MEGHGAVRGRGLCWEERIIVPISRRKWLRHRGLQQRSNPDECPQSLLPHEVPTRVLMCPSAPKGSRTEFCSCHRGCMSLESHLLALKSSLLPQQLHSTSMLWLIFAELQCGGHCKNINTWVFFLSLCKVCISEDRILRWEWTSLGSEAALSLACHRSPGCTPPAGPSAAAYCEPMSYICSALRLKRVPVNAPCI